MLTSVAIKKRMVNYPAVRRKKRRFRSRISSGPPYVNKKRRRGSWAKKSRGGYSSMSVPAGLPSSIRRCKLRYNQQQQMSSTAGVINKYFFRANSLFDPDSTGIGTQPYPFDTMASLFNHYLVLGSKMTLKVRAANAVPYYCGIYLTDAGSISYTTASEFISAKHGTYKVGVTDKPCDLVAKYSAKKFFNVTDVKDNSTKLGALVTANPTEAAYFCVWVQAMSGGTTTVTLDVTIDFISSWSEPKDLAAS